MPPFSAVPPSFTNLKNNVASTLAVALTNNATSLTVSSGTGVNFPNAPFYVSCEFEVLLCSSKAGDVLTVTRGQDGTAALAHVINSIVELRDTAIIIKDAYDGVNSAFTAINSFGTQVGNKTALPSDTVYLDTTQELTHKTLDLVNASKANVIIGNVQPDPAALNYQNMLINGGFDDWSYPPSTTLSAGAPASGNRSASFCNGWLALGKNDSAITVTKDAANTDPGFPSGYDCLVNLSTVQGSDWVHLEQQFTAGDTVGPNDLSKIMGNPVSISYRVKLISGNVSVRAFLWNWDGTTVNSLISAPTTVTSTYSTIKFENQVLVPNRNIIQAGVNIEFQGVGQVAIDNVMLIIGPVATVYRPDFPSITNARLAPSVQRANLLVNGGFEVWQRGSGPFTAASTYSVDRWVVYAPGGTTSVSRDSANADLAAGASYCAAITTVTPSATIGNGFYQVIDSNTDFMAIRGRQLSVSVRVKCSQANSVRVGLEGDKVNAGPSVWSAYHSGGGVYQTLTATITLGVVNGLTIWITGVVAGTWYVDNAMLVVGSVPADYVPLHPADDLARCLRYYETIGGNGSTGFQRSFWAGSASGYMEPLRYARKAITPSLTKVGTWNCSNCGQPSILYPDLDVCGVIVTPGAAGTVQFYNTPGAYFAVEANP